MALCVVFGVSAWAQTPAGEPPMLPAIDVTAPLALPPNATASADMPPVLPIIPGTANNALPELPILTEATLPAAKAKEKAAAATTAPAQTSTSVPLADLPPLPESTEQAANKPVTAEKTEEEKNAEIASMAPVLPVIPAATTTSAAAPAPDAGIPSIPAPPALNLTLPAIDNHSMNAAITALPEVNVGADRPKEKTWKTTLAPTTVPMRTKFNYKRVMMPSAIYASDYNDLNKHLPKAQTRQDYENLLFVSASKNDIVATRALLNAGTDINSTDANGDTALTIARRSGAYATAELLVIRGAH